MTKSSAYLAMCAATVVWLLPVNVSAQSPGGSFVSNTTRVDIQHPPRVALKGITKVAVLEYDGECGAELTDRLMSLVRESAKFEVIERSQFGALLDEQNLHATGRIDAGTATRLGLLVGPAGIIIGRVTRCDTEVKNNLVERDERTGAIIRFVSRTKVSLSASFRLVEVKTGTAIVAKTFDGVGELTTSSRVGQPEAPDRHTVTSLAYNNWLAQVSPLILPWSETVEFRVHTKDPGKQDWGLKNGSDDMRKGRFDEAIKKFRAGLAAHEEEQTADAVKYVPQLYWNLGVALTYAGEPLEGIKYLQKSDAARPDRSKTDEGIQAAIAKAREIDRTQRAFAMQQENLVGITVGGEPPPSNPAKVPVATPSSAVQPIAVTTSTPPPAAPTAPRATTTARPPAGRTAPPPASAPSTSKVAPASSAAPSVMTNAALDAELKKYADKDSKLTILKALMIQRRITLDQYNDRFLALNKAGR